MKIALFGNSYQIEKSTQVKRLFSSLSKYDVELAICSEYYQFLIHQMNLMISPTEIIESDDFHADIALSLGGDGTFLRTAQRVGSKQIPILGINTGRLGFLADVSGNQIEEVITEVFKNYYRVEDRSLLELTAPCIEDGFYPYALNEIALSKRDSSSMITIDLYINNEFLNAYQADGLIISTPTGSTAYSLSVGGPIIAPQNRCMVITPVAPHSLNMRPLVISDDSVLRIKVESRSDNFLVGVDGRPLIFDTHSELVIKKASFPTKVIKRHNQSFYETLRTKLYWGADKRG